MKATIVTIGDEILIGQIVDTNSGYIAKALDKIGVQTTEILSISDDKQQILNTFSSLQNKVDFVIITGGLGPTKDDITKKTFCDYFEDTFVRNQEVEDHIVALFTKLNFIPTQVNKDQALLPSKAQVLRNNYGTAAGMWMQKEKTIFVSMPGVPYEMKGIVNEELIPKIVSEFKRPYIIHKTILTYGQGESMVAERIENWENNLPEFIKLAYLPSPGKVRLRLTARGKNKDILDFLYLHYVTNKTNTDFWKNFTINNKMPETITKLLKEGINDLSLSSFIDTPGKIFNWSNWITVYVGNELYNKDKIKGFLDKQGEVRYTEIVKEIDSKKHLSIPLNKYLDNIINEGEKV
jgi:nicotinamide-nucleotide amidase